jgi:hypothetical protein
VRWILNVVLICIFFMARNVEHFFMCFLTIWTSSFEKALLVHLPISSLSHWFFGSLDFWAPCIFWLLVPCLMYSWQRFSSHSVSGLFNLVTFLLLLLCSSFLISCSPICQSFLLVAEPFEFYLVSHCLCLLIPVYSLFFHAQLQSFRSYIKVLIPLWVDCTG